MTTQGKKSEQGRSQAENLKKMRLAHIQESENHGKIGVKSAKLSHVRRPRKTEEQGRERGGRKKTSRGGASQKIALKLLSVVHRVFYCFPSTMTSLCQTD
jgi:hypothetical protein